MNEYQTIMKSLRDGDGVKRVISQKNNRILLDLIQDFQDKERLRLIDLIERLEIGNCEGPEIAYVISRMYVMKITSLVNTTVNSGFPEVGFAIANMLHDAGVVLGSLTIEAILKAHEDNEDR